MESIGTQILQDLENAPNFGIGIPGLDNNDSTGTPQPDENANDPLKVLLERSDGKP
jgi:hypothetical protein